MAKAPLHHIERGMLPWRSERMTECGRAVDRPTWTRGEAVAEYERLGRQQFSLAVCMTCYNTANNNPDWDHNPISCMHRHTGWGSHEERLTAELRAIATLIEAHRDEFDGTVAALLDASELAAKRQERRQPGLSTKTIIGYRPPS